MQLAEFIEEFKDAITQQTMQNYRPLYMFDVSSYQDRIRQLRRKPFNSQSHCIAGLAKCFEEGHRSAFLVGEMGVGKTLIGAATSFVAGFKKVLILCPPHLVKKWEREVKSTVPLSQVFILKTTDDVNKAIDLAHPDKSNYFIISRERAKLSFSWKPVFLQPTVRDGHRCSDMIACPSCGGLILNEDGLPISFEMIQKKKWRCRNSVDKDKVCNAPLWQADREGPRRYSLADYIKKNYKGYFDFLVLDECHEYKGQGSAQGYAVAALASSCQNVLAMTGTILGGYSTSLFYLLYRLTNDFKKLFNHNESIRFAQKYGILERICRHKNDWNEDGVSSKRRQFSTTTVERPGVSPEIITHLINKTAFMRLSDVAEILPPYQDIVETLDMEGQQKEEYKVFSEKLQEELRKELVRGSKKLLGAYLQSLLCYPDAPWREEIVTRRHGNQEEIVAAAPALSAKDIYPKEKRIIDLCLEEKRQSRKVIIYCTHTETRDITERLKTILQPKGLNVVILKSHTVSSEKREDWVKEKVQEGIDVLICQPRLVQTGLDLIDFPTLVFYQIEYSVYTVRQAARRSWRIGQKNHVKVYYLTYTETIQEKGLHLVAKKVRASLMVEGELLSEGLSAQAAEEDMLTQLAKSLVHSTATKESAEALFSSCRESFNFNQSFIGHEIPSIQNIDEPQDVEVKGDQEPSVSLLWDDLKAKYGVKKSTVKEFVNNPDQLILF
jgi:SNF2 family DNA or RNA helicase